MKRLTCITALLALLIWGFALAPVLAPPAEAQQIHATKPRPGAQLDYGHPLSRGLVGWWLFNEGAGNRLSDISGKGNHGVLTNGPTWVGSQYGGGLSFDGVDDFSRANGFLGIITYPYSVSFRFLSTSGAVVAPFWIGDASAPNQYTGFVLNFPSSGNISLRQRDGGAEDGLTANDKSYTDGVWHTVIGVISNATLRELYVDGVSKGTSTVSRAFPGVNRVTVGQFDDSTPSDPFNGRLDDASVYNRALSASEIQQLYVSPYANILGGLNLTRRFAPAAAGSPTLRVIIIAGPTEIEDQVRAGR